VGRELIVGVDRITRELVQDDVLIVRGYGLYSSAIRVEENQERTVCFAAVSRRLKRGKYSPGPIAA
jgi:hypothetical protein